MASKPKETETVQPVKPSLYNLQGERVEMFDIELMGVEGYEGPELICNFDPKSREGMERIFYSQMKGTTEVGSPASESFPVSWWILERHTRFKDEEGNTQIGVTLTLIDPEKHTLVMTSHVLLRFWKMILKMCGVGPYDPPQKVRIIVQKSGKGRRIFVLAPVVD